MTEQIAAGASGMPIDQYTVLGTTAIIMDAQATPHIMFRNADKHRLEYAVGR